MSCTVIAVPYALAWIIGTVVTATAASFKVAEDAVDLLQGESCESTYENQDNCEEVHTITTDFFIDKDFETPFLDKEILRKTLEEHGVINIAEYDSEISGFVDGYKLTFRKVTEDKPYNLRIHCSDKYNAEEKISDLSSEYSMNVQEDAYLHIIDKLKENNMTIEEEIVEDDNTIVLTVNIE